MLSDDLSAIPRFAAHWLTAVVDDATLLVQSEHQCALLQGRALVCVAQAIDGQRNVQQLTEQLKPHMSPLELAYVLDRLELAGYLQSATKQHPEPFLGHKQGWSNNPPNQSVNTVQLKSTGIDVEPLQQQLQLAGLTCSPTADLTILVCEDYLQPQLATLIEATQGPVLLTKLTGKQILIGPLFDTSSEPCWHCLQHAIRWNRPVQQGMQRLGVDSSLPTVSSKSSIAAATGLLSLITTRILAGDRSLRHSLRCIELDTLNATPHTIRQRPQCPQCGNPDWMQQQAEQAIKLEAVDIQFKAEGGYRTQSPQQTLNQYRQLISPITGVVNYLHPMPHRHGGYRKVYVSGYQVCPQNLSSDNGFDKICAGKGQTDEQAQASALCEALERVSSVWQGDESLIVTSIEQLQHSQQHYLPLNAVQNFSTDQFTQRQLINALTQDRRRQVPEPLEATAEIGWTRAWSLTDGLPTWIPATYCFAETPHALGSAYGLYNPNGTAAGNCLEEAVFQGLLELIERDATAIWWYNQLARPTLDLTVFDEPYFALLHRDYQDNGWQTRVIDLTHDLGIPVYAAVAHHEQQQRYAIGFGCHLQPRLAVSRALTELNQLMDQRPTTPPPWNSRLLANPEFLFPKQQTQAIVNLDSGHNLQQDIDIIINRLNSADLSVYALNKTRPDIGLSVAQLIVPGLRHFWPRFDRGRLYDVPVSMGWQATATAETDLNPAPLFL